MSKYTLFLSVAILGMGYAITPAFAEGGQGFGHSRGDGARGGHHQCDEGDTACSEERQARREAIQNMTPEEREEYRQLRRAQNDGDEAGEDRGERDGRHDHHRAQIREQIQNLSETDQAEFQAMREEMQDASREERRAAFRGFAEAHGITLPERGERGERGEGGEGRGQNRGNFQGANDSTTE